MQSERNLRSSRSRSNDRLYTEPTLDPREETEASINSFHRAPENQKSYVVVRAYVDGKVRFVDFTTKKTANSHLRLLETEYYAGDYGEHFAKGDRVAAHFPKTSKTPADFYDASIAGVFATKDEAVALCKELAGSKNSKKAPRASNNQALSRLQSVTQNGEPDQGLSTSMNTSGISSSAGMSDGSFVQSQDTSIQSIDYDAQDGPVSSSQQNAATQQASCASPPESLSSAVGEALSALSGFETSAPAPTGTRPDFRVPISMPPIDTPAMLPSGAQVVQVTGGSMTPAVLPVPPSARVTGEPSMASTAHGKSKGKRASSRMLQLVAPADIVRFYANDPTRHEPEPVGPITDKIGEDYPIIHRCDDDVTYEFYWQKQRSCHQVEFLPGYQIFIYRSVMKAFKLHGPTEANPSFIKYAWEIVKHLMGDEKGIKKCYDNRLEGHGIDKILGAKTVEGICVHLEESFNVTIILQRLKANFNTKLIMLHQRKLTKPNKKRTLDTSAAQMGSPTRRLHRCA